MMDKEWMMENFRQREIMQSHRSLEDEFSFYEAVKKGDVVRVQKNCDDDEFSNAVGMNELSGDALQNTRYHFIITAAMVSRFCIEGGMELEQAYGLSDYYIKKMDKCKKCADIVKLHHVMVLDFTEKMKALIERPSVSKAVRMTIDYIYLHLHSRIKLEELAENAKVSEGHLSKLFKKEMQISISDYICMLKLESAQDLLKYSDMSLVEIANYLAFASQSYFVHVFHSKIGLTPRQYREKFSKSDHSYIWQSEQT